MIVTFTKNDKACVLAYPVASRIARQIGVDSATNDKYVRAARWDATVCLDPASLPVVKVGCRRRLRFAKAALLEATEFVSGHSDIAGRSGLDALCSRR